MRFYAIPARTRERRLAPFALQGCVLVGVFRVSARGGGGGFLPVWSPLRVDGNPEPIFELEGQTCWQVSTNTQAQLDI